jgi:hypothetical protein
MPVVDLLPDSLKTREEAGGGSAPRRLGDTGGWPEVDLLPGSLEAREDGWWSICSMVASASISAGRSRSSDL